MVHASAGSEDREEPMQKNCLASHRSAWYAPPSHLAIPMRKQGVRVPKIPVRVSPCLKAYISNTTRNAKNRNFINLCIASNMGMNVLMNDVAMYIATVSAKRRYIMAIRTDVWSDFV